MTISTATFGTLLTRFFTQRLMGQRHASPHTISSYRDTFRLLLQFAHARLKKAPAQLAWNDIDAPLISAFLDDLQTRRKITARSRNIRLTAIRSLFRYAAFELPAQSEQIQRVLAIPNKRCVRKQVDFLTQPEVDALLAAPDPRTWSGCRDHAWLLLALQTGLRLSELTGLTRQDLHLDAGAYVHVLGKGRKERCIPLTKQTVAVLRAWRNTLRAAMARSCSRTASVSVWGARGYSICWHNTRPRPKRRAPPSRANACHLTSFATHWQWSCSTPGLRRP